ncbi:hypothetical protein GCM10023155_19620 [Bremerella cremea]
MFINLTKFRSPDPCKGLAWRPTNYDVNGTPRMAWNLECPKQFRRFHLSNIGRYGMRRGRGNSIMKIVRM